MKRLSFSARHPSSARIRTSNSSSCAFIRASESHLTVLPLRS
ncbi:MAG: hypothetical protein WBH94_09655 [Methanoculleus sp.]